MCYFRTPVAFGQETSVSLDPLDGIREPDLGFLLVLGLLPLGFDLIRLLRREWTQQG